MIPVKKEGEKHVGMVERHDVNPAGFRLYCGACNDYSGYPIHHAVVWVWI